MWSFKRGVKGDFSSHLLRFEYLASYDKTIRAKCLFESKNLSLGFWKWLKYLSTLRVVVAATTSSVPLCKHGIEFIEVTKLKDIKEVFVKYWLKTNLLYLR